MALTTDNFKDAKIDVGGIQETRSRHFGNFHENGYDCFFSGFLNGVFPPGGTQQGVMLCFRKCREIEVKSVEYVSPRIIHADVTIHGLKIRFFSFYAPQNGCSSDDKDEFWDRLSAEVDKTPQGYQYQLLGDTNATTSAVRCKITRFHGQELDDMQSNDNGHRLIHFVAEHHAHVASTYFKHKPRHTYTHYGAQGFKKCIDLCLNNGYLQKRCLDSRVRYSYDFGSGHDHKLVVSRFKIERRRMRIDRKPRIATKKKVDFKAVTEEHKLEFLQLVENGKYTNAGELIGSLESASTALPKVSKNVKHTFPWNNDENLKALFRQRKGLLERNNFIEYRRVNKLVRKRVNELRNEHYAQEAAKFNEANSRRDVEKAYKIAKEQATTRRQKVKQSAIPGLSTHFHTHFTHSTPNDTPLILQKPMPQPKHPIPYNILPPTAVELTTIIKQAKNGKASLDIPMELLKLAIESPSFILLLTEFYGKIWETTTVPEYLGESMITALWKNKGSRSDVKTWRGIMLSSILTKILSCVFVTRISEVYNKNLGPGQMGFRSGKGCQDGNYCLKCLHQWCRKTQRELYVGMVDLSAAFDWIDRDFTWEAVRHIIGDSILITIMEDMYSKTSAYMKDDEMNAFLTTCGVRQGGTESPYAYNCLAQRCLDTFDDRCEQAGIESFKVPYKIPKTASKTGEIEKGECTAAHLEYADDEIINAFSKEDLERKLNILWEVFAEFGLYMNLDKTETVIYNWKNGKIPEKIPYAPYPETICTIKGHSIKNSRKFKYLGAFSQYDDSSIGESELQNRITSGTCKFYELKNFFTNKKITLNIRIQYLHSLVRSRMTYLCGGWTITQAQINRLDAAYIKFLRHMVKGGRQRTAAITYTRKNGTEGTYSKPILTKEQILKLTKIETLNEFINRQQEKWIAHCVRADDDSYIKQLTFPDYYTGEAKKPGILNSTYRQVLLRFKKANCKCTSAKCKCNADEMITRFRDRNPRGVTTHAHDSEV